MSPSILFYTIASGGYSKYVLPFVCAAIALQKNAWCEVLTNAEDVERLNKQLPEMAKGHVLIREIPPQYLGWRIIPVEKRVDGYGSRHPSGSIRWLEAPTFVADYIYTCDCDILLTDPNLLDFHLHRMAVIGLPYSNIVRQVLPGLDQQRMTGCHFAQYRPWFQRVDSELMARMFTDLDSGIFNYYDERLLYHLAESTFGLPPEATRGNYALRPIHGLHVASSRAPTDRLGWNINPTTIAQYRALEKTTIWQRTKGNFAPEYNAMLKRLEEAIRHES